MPGYVMHLAMAYKIMEEISIDKPLDKAYFLVGSIIPDIKKASDKMDSHYWPAGELDYFVRKPNLNNYIREYGDRMNEPYIMGYYSHLYLDYQYLIDYWKKHFIFLDEAGMDATRYEEVKKVYLKDNKKVYSRSEFFSDKYYYGDYDRINNSVIEDFDISADKCLDAVQKVLQDTNNSKYHVGGIKIADSGDKLISMVDSVKNYRSTTKQNKSLVLDYKEIHNLILKTAHAFSEKYMD